MPLVAPEPIESKRLLVRLAGEEDLPSLLEVNSSDEVTALLPYATWSSLADAKAWYQRMAAMQGTGLALQFVVVSKATGSAIGSCLLFRFDAASARAELGYVLGRAHWGQGLMNEALRALLDCAFTGMGLRRVEAEVDTRNARSALLLRRLGFVKEGLLRQRWVAKGQAKDVEMYGLLRSEWQPGVAGSNGRTGRAPLPADIRAFFESYRAAFDALDGAAVARLYAVPSGIASDRGYTPWPTLEPIGANMVALCELYRANGYVRAQFEPVAFIAQGEHYAVADIEWEIHWRNKEASRFNTTYNLARRQDGWRVLLCTAYGEEGLSMPASPSASPGEG